jgi:4-aminobutyrate aminotransferase
MEPLQGEGGYLLPDPEFVQTVKAACEKHGALFIADEVQAGAGRTGKMWSVEHAGVEPDMMTFGKGMGGDLPMAGVLMRRDLAVQLDDHSQPQTFAANALSAEVCMTNLDIIERDGLVQRAAEVGEEAMQRLKAAAEELTIIGDVRGRGLMIGIELVANRETREPISHDRTGAIVDAMLQRGVIMVPCGRYGNVLRLMPSLTIPRSYLNAGIDIMLDLFRNAQ